MCTLLIVLLTAFLYVFIFCVNLRSYFLYYYILVSLRLLTEFSNHCWTNISFYCLCPSLFGPLRLRQLYILCHFLLISWLLTGLSGWIFILYFFNHERSYLFIATYCSILGYVFFHQGIFTLFMDIISCKIRIDNEIKWFK